MICDDFSKSLDEPQSTRENARLKKINKIAHQNRSDADMGYGFVGLFQGKRGNPHSVYRISMKAPFRRPLEDSKKGIIRRIGFAEDCDTVNRVAFIRLPGGRHGRSKQK